MRSGILAEFDSADALARAYERLVASGYRRLSSWSPYAVRSVVRAEGRSPMPGRMLVGGLLGAGFGYLVQWWCNAVSYPIDVGGRPLNSAPAFIPITFESAVLAASLTGFFSLLARSGLPRLGHPLFLVDGFDRAAVDRFWIGVDDADPRFDDGVVDELTRLGALRCTRLPPGIDGERS
jgi:hypothetical protein